MKTKITSLLLGLILLITSNLNAQAITGESNGVLNAMGNQVRLVFHIHKTDSGYTATFDSPDQGAMNLPFTSTTFQNDTLRLTAENIGAFYKGVLEADSITGIWNQGGQSFTLNMSRDKVEKEIYKRPQEPEEPYPYYEEEVIFENKQDSLTLAGTPTLPQKQALSLPSS